MSDDDAWPSQLARRLPRRTPPLHRGLPPWILRQPKLAAFPPVVLRRLLPAQARPWLWHDASASSSWCRTPPPAALLPLQPPPGAPPPMEPPPSPPPKDPAVPPPAPPPIDPPGAPAPAPQAV